jgi:peptide/nickel transport system substrate-binding protein
MGAHRGAEQNKWEADMRKYRSALVLVAAMMALAALQPVFAQKVGGDIVIGITGDPYNLATWTSNDLNSSLVMNLALPPMMATDNAGNKVPYVIKDYKISADAKTYTVTLHDLSWHDGKPLTSTDLGFTCDYLVKYKLGYGADMFGNVESYDIKDAHTIVFHLKKPQVNFLSQAGFWVDIMPKHIYENVTDPNTFAFNGVGYGPFKLKDYKKGEYYTFERVPNWPLANGGKGAYLNTVTFRIYPDPNALVLAIKAGEVQASGSALPVAAQKQLTAEPAKFGVSRVTSLGFGYFSFSYKNELLKDPVVRRAIAMTVDRDAIVNVAKQGGAIKMETPVSPVFTDLVKSNIKYPAFDIDAAAKLLDGAGYKPGKAGVREKNGKALEFELIYRTTTANIDSIVNIFKANAEKAGLKINLKAVDPATYTDRVVKQRNFDINCIEWGVIDDADSSLATIYRSDASLNFMNYKNDAIDKLLDDVQVESDYRKRVALMDKFQTEFVKEIPTVNAWVTLNAYGWSKAYEGWDLTPGLYGVVDTKDLVKVYKK